MATSPVAPSRLQQIANYFRPQGLDKLLVKNPDDVVICMAVRSPLCKARKGGYKDMSTDELMTAFYKAIIPKLPVEPAMVESITMGTVLPPKAAYEARAAAIAAGFPDTASVQIINRFCSSGLMAIQSIANEIRNDEITIGLALGFESMSGSPDRGPNQFSEEIMNHPVAKDCAQPMGWTSENVAAEFNITRERMDEFAAMSHSRAERAQREGKFDEEIVPVEALQADPATPKDAKVAQRHKVLVKQDDGIRKGTSKEGLAKVRAAFPQWPPSNTTGGNASQVTDGAAAVLLMKRKTAEELGCPILGKHVATSVSGLAPRIMGIGPSLAIPKVLARVGLTLDQVDLFEINEAFASMYVYCVEKLGLDVEKVNVNGGAIALGHPLGCTGARQVATGLAEARRRGGKVLVTSMCIGLGMGAAAVFIVE